MIPLLPVPTLCLHLVWTSSVIPSLGCHKIIVMKESKIIKCKIQWTLAVLSLICIYTCPGNGWGVCTNCRLLHLEKLL